MDRDNNDIVIDIGGDGDDNDDMTTAATARPAQQPHTPRKTPSKYPPLPRTSDARIAQAVPHVCPAGPVAAASYEQAQLADSSEKQRHILPTTNTVLYLAYGSNMAAATFQGARGIRPLSAVPVSVPTLRLTFDLPGIPYREPCFANTAIRRLPKVPKRPDIPDIPDVPDVPDLPVPQPPSTGPIRPPLRKNSSNSSRPAWRGPLYGVVYEVTAADYARIVATEGGGASYQEVVVPCLAEPPRMGVPERPVRPPRAFLAKTLWAPQVPLDDDDNDDDDDDDDDSWKNVLHRKWNAAVAAVVRFSAGRMRADPEYAQPSARYLGLLTTGAAEHELPDAYQAWLAALAAYRATHWRQHAGALLVLLVVLVPFLVVFLASRLVRFDSGRLPAWARVASGAAMHGMWVVYDHVLRPVFGDGEHTEGEEDDTLRGRQ